MMKIGARWVLIFVVMALVAMMAVVAGCPAKEPAMPEGIEAPPPPPP